MKEVLRRVSQRRHHIAVTDGRFWAHGDRWGCAGSGTPAPVVRDKT